MSTNTRRFVVMGAGEVGFHLAKTLSQEGHSVRVIEVNPEKYERLEELDVQVIAGNGAHVPVLESAGVENSDLFIAVSSSDEANLAASILAKRLGAQRTLVRVGVAEDVTTYRRVYEEVFAADTLISTELLASTRILNHILGHNTLAVEYLARGKVQLRRIHLEQGSVLTHKPLRDVQMPRGSLVAAFFHGDELIIPSGNDKAQPGDDALIMSTADVIDEVETKLSCRARQLGAVVIAGGGATGSTVAKALARQVDRIRIIEQNRRRAEELAVEFPDFEILHGDATDESLLRAERIADARAFIALTGNDERNLLACLLARDLGVPRVVALVERTDTSHLWRKLDLMEVISPRQLACERVQNYVRSGFSANIVSLQHGAAQVLERRLYEASPAAGVTLAEISPPRGMIVGAVVRGKKVFVPRGNDRLEVGDTVILFVHQEHVPTVHLLFPGREPV